jgi:peptidoglycan/LPS O-acetylase OafA/YrhL
VFKEAVPRLARVALIFNPDLRIGQQSFYLDTIEAAVARYSGMVVRIVVRDSAEIAPAIEAFATEPDGCIIAVPRVGALPFCHPSAIGSHCDTGCRLLIMGGRRASPRRAADIVSRAPTRRLNETAGFHCGARERGGMAAAGGERAAAKSDKAHRVDRRLCRANHHAGQAGAGKARMDRGLQLNVGSGGPGGWMTKHQSASYLPYIDGLRAVAVLSVMTYHLRSSLLPGGFSGVDIFFVISGFVVSASLGQFDTKSLSFVLFFYARRALRIAPALVICLLVTSFATTVLVPDSWLSDLNQSTGFFAFFGLSNVILATNTDTYFSPRSEFNPFTHTWSLGVEEQFYLVFPFIFLLWVLQKKRQSIALFGVLFMCSLAYSAWIGRIDSKFAFYMFPSRFWELAAGVLLFQIVTASGYWERARRGPAPQWFKAGGAASSALVVSGLVFGNSEAFPFPGAAPTVIGSLGLLLFLYGRGRENFLVRALTTGPALFVGRISYSLYLWHWPVFVLFRWTVGLEGAIFQAAATVIAFAFAISSYYFVEPLRYWSVARRAPRYAIIAATLAVLTGSGWVAAQTHQAGPAVSVSTVIRNVDDWYPDYPNRRAGDDFPGCHSDTTQRNVGTSFVVIRHRAGCDRPLTGPRLFAIGDSHTAAYSAMFQAYSNETGAPASMYVNAGCPFLGLRAPREDCRATSDLSTADLLESVQPGDVLFIANLNLPRLADAWKRFSEREVADAMSRDEAERATAVAAAQIVLRRFYEHGVRVVLEAPKPLFKAPTYRCVEIYNRTNEICAGGLAMNRVGLEEYRKPVLLALLRLGGAVPGVSIWDPFSILCPPDQFCRAIMNGRPLYFDGDHISGYANRLLFPSFRDFIVMTAHGAPG